MPLTAPEQSVSYNKLHRIDARQPLLFGFVDGGRNMRFDDANRAVSSPREIIVVQPPEEDPHLRGVIETARAGAAPLQTVLQKADYLNDYVREVLKVGNEKRNEELIAALCGEQGSAGTRITMGQLIEAQTGVCRHRSILLKILADEIGIPAALVRGFYARGEGDEQSAFGHAWNEVTLESGKRIIVDAMHDMISEYGTPQAGHYADMEGACIYHEGNGMADTLPIPLPSSFRDRADEVALVTAAAWRTARSPFGGRSAYLFKDKLDPGQLAALDAALTALEIRHDDYATSLDAPEGQRRDVVRVRGGGYLMLREAGAFADQ